MEISLYLLYLYCSELYYFKMCQKVKLPAVKMQERSELRHHDRHSEELHGLQVEGLFDGRWWCDGVRLVDYNDRLLGMNSAYVQSNQKHPSQSKSSLKGSLEVLERWEWSQLSDEKNEIFSDLLISVTSRQKISIEKSRPGVIKLRLRLERLSHNSPCFSEHAPGSI